MMIRRPLCLAKGCREPLPDPRAAQFCPACARDRARAAEARDPRPGTRKARVAYPTATNQQLFASVTLPAEPWSTAP